MDMTEYETSLRAKLAEAEAADTRADEQLENTEAHPMSADYKALRDAAAVSAGRVLGLTEALNLLTGEQQPPNIAMVRRARAEG